MDRLDFWKADQGEYQMLFTFCRRYADKFKNKKIDIKKFVDNFHQAFYSEGFNEYNLDDGKNFICKDINGEIVGAVDKQFIEEMSNYMY